MTHVVTTSKPSILNGNVTDHSPLFKFDFDEKEFEDHLKAATSHLKDDFSHSSYSSKTSATSFSEFSSFL